MAGTHDCGSKKCKPSREISRKSNADRARRIWVGVNERMAKRAAQRNQRRKPDKPSANGFG